MDSTVRYSKNYYAEREVMHKTEAIITGAERRQLIEELQQKANRIQDELDDFNASHRICIEVDE